MYLNVLQVRIADDIAQFLLVKIGRIGARTKHFSREIDGIRSIFNSSIKSLFRSRRREQFYQ